MTNNKMKDFFTYLRDNEYGNGSSHVAHAIELILEHVDTDSAEEQAEKIYKAYWEDTCALLNKHTPWSGKLITALAKLEREQGSTTIADYLEEIKEFTTPEAIAIEVFKMYHGKADVAQEAPFGPDVDSDKVEYTRFNFETLEGAERCEELLADFDIVWFSKLNPGTPQEGKLYTYIDCEDGTIHGTLYINHNDACSSLLASPGLLGYISAVIAEEDIVPQDSPYSIGVWHKFDQSDIGMPDTELYANGMADAELLARSIIQAGQSEEWYVSIDSLESGAEIKGFRLQFTKGFTPNGERMFTIIEE